MKPSKIVEILHSIKDVKIEDDGDVVVYFNDSEEGFVVREFNRNSFTRELIELIEDYATEGTRPCLDSMSEDEAPPEEAPLSEEELP